jgi:hypothetical protein
MKDIASKMLTKEKSKTWNVYKKNLLLREHITEELSCVYRSIEKAENAWKKAMMSSDESYYDSCILNLYHTYHGLEKIFKQIAQNIDETIPEGKNQCRELLKQMRYKVEGIRPSLISNELYALLDEFRSFRRIVRNDYTFNYVVAKLEILIKHLVPMKAKLKKELEEFCMFLDHI